MILNSICLQVVRLDSRALIPQFAYEFASGFDLFSIEEASIKPNSTSIISTGLAFIIPRGYEVQIRSKSGIALKNEVIVLNSPGTIDSDYRGEIKVILSNLSKEIFEIKQGQKIAQGVLSKLPKVNLLEISKEDFLKHESLRGEKGFGSSGIKG